ncbi:hypothetical protein ADUPG1_009456 [Aduncisulcus paluster]|uniref:Uncharacterized protein n=1 Tax=Aduncisulcus paluster TaxID=2918883 RepID=A0ABQ5KVL9_9EUKA|nr:hypothetical protein ADUPG1_009456 [Aduncisulcus paluster]
MDEEIFSKILQTKEIIAQMKKERKILQDKLQKLVETSTHRHKELIRKISKLEIIEKELLDKMRIRSPKELSTDRILPPESLDSLQAKFEVIRREREPMAKRGALKSLILANMNAIMLCYFSPSSKTTSDGRKLIGCFRNPPGLETKDFIISSSAETITENWTQLQSYVHELDITLQLYEKTKLKLY